MILDCCSITDYELVKSGIGRGASGQVDLMKVPKTGDTVAVKIFHGSLSSTEAKKFLAEVDIMSSLRHPSLISIYDYQIPDDSNRNQAAIVMEYMPNGSLRDLIKQNNGYNKMRVMWEIARGMKYLHSQGKMHCDLKPENVLFDKDMHAKIGDFGLSRNEETMTTFGIRTPQYMAPELFKTSGYNHKVDVFAFGQMMIEVLSGEQLFVGANPMVVMGKMMEHNLPPIPDEIEAPMKELIEKCRAFDPCERPEFSTIEKILRKYVSVEEIESEKIRELELKGQKELAKELVETSLVLDGLLKQINDLQKTYEQNLKMNSVVYAIDMMWAISEGNFEEAVCLIEEGTDVNYADEAFDIKQYKMFALHFVFSEYLINNARPIIFVISDSASFGVKTK